MLVPVNLLEVIANVLLVIRILRPSRSVLVGGPEAGGIGGKNFIGQRDALGGASKLKFGVGDDDAALPGISCRLLVDAQREVAQMAGGLDADDFAHLIERNILIVAGCRLGRWREDGLGKASDSLSPAGSSIPRDLAGGFVFLPGRAGNVAAHDALDGKHFGTPHQHGASAQLVGVLANVSRIFVDVGGDQMVGDDVGEVVEPEQARSG